jgi:hypothetical protein
MLPILLLLGLAALVGLTTRKQAIAKLSAPVTSAGKTDPALHIKALNRVITSGEAPKRWLVDEAMREAFELGDWLAVSALADKFPIAFQTQSPEESSHDDKSPPEDASKPPSSSSPIEGVGPDEWTEFTTQLRTQEPSFKNERAIGAYHHNIDRLTQLGIEPSSLENNESAQLAAISKDIAEYRKSERKLIDDFGGDLIQIEGKTHPITMSGILGVIKAAGPRNARQWFKDPEDRASHPRTTETFLRTNGVF